MKLTRVAFLAPALGCIAFFFPGETGRGKMKFGLPWFVIGFLAVVALQSLLALPTAIVDMGQQAAQFLLLLAVTATGIRSPMVMLLSQGWRAALPVVGATLTALLLGLIGALLLA